VRVSACLRFCQVQVLVQASSAHPKDLELVGVGGCEPDGWQGLCVLSPDLRPLGAGQQT
jgi:hypothetical protein